MCLRFGVVDSCGLGFAADWSTYSTFDYLQQVATFTLNNLTDKVFLSYPCVIELYIIHINRPTEFVQKS